jgi:hypothetical protein
MCSEHRSIRITSFKIKKFEFYKKIVYLKDLWTYFVYKQPKMCTILYIFNVAANHTSQLTSLTTQRDRSININVHPPFFLVVL